MAAGMTCQCKCHSVYRGRLGWRNMNSNGVAWEMFPDFNEVLYNHLGYATACGPHDGIVSCPGQALPGGTGYRPRKRGSRLSTKA